jgi:hypothetical protein
LFNALKNSSQFQICFCPRNSNSKYVPNFEPIRKPWSYLHILALLSHKIKPGLHNATSWFFFILVLLLIRFYKWIQGNLFPNLALFNRASSLAVILNSHAEPSGATHLHMDIGCHINSDGPATSSVLKMSLVWVTPPLLAWLILDQN